MDEIKAPQASAQDRQQIRIDVSAARTTYANVALVSTSGEEFTVTFGIVSPEEGAVKASDRLILSPRNAKRLAMSLAQVVKAYEDKLGIINVAPVSLEGAKKQ